VTVNQKQVKQSKRLKTERQRLYEECMRYVLSRECTDLGTDSNSLPIPLDGISSDLMKHHSSILLKSALLFVLANAITAYSYRRHRALISLCCRLESAR